MPIKPKQRWMKTNNLGTVLIEIKKVFPAMYCEAEVISAPSASILWSKGVWLNVQLYQIQEDWIYLEGQDAP